jgi:hypothetical protein
MEMGISARAAARTPRPIQRDVKWWVDCVDGSGRFILMMPELVVGDCDRSCGWVVSVESMIGNKLVADWVVSVGLMSVCESFLEPEITYNFDEVAVVESSDVKFAGNVLVKPSGEGGLKWAGLNLSSAATIVGVTIPASKFVWTKEIMVFRGSAVNVYCLSEEGSTLGRNMAFCRLEGMDRNGNRTKTASCTWIRLHWIRILSKIELPYFQGRP